MQRHLLTLLALCSGPLAAGCFGSPPTTGAGPGSDPNADPACQLDTKNEKSPGYPFSVEKFTSDVLPAVTKNCAAGGCHGAPTGNGGLILWADAAPGNCNFGKTFNQVIGKIDLSTPANSSLINAVSGASQTHPFKFAADAPELAALTGFATDAAKTFAAGGGGTTPPPGPSPFDYTVYQSKIQTAIDAATCAKSGCHGTAAGGFTLKAAPAAGGADMQANFIAVTSRANLADPANSLVLLKATTSHGGGLSTQVSAAAAADMLAWITAAKVASGGGDNGNPSCAPTSLFNAGVFQSEILPILSGQLNLNQAGGLGHGPGCMSSACHGQNRGPGKLSLLASADTATNLQNFACFVNVASPSLSPIVECPLGYSCAASGGNHPGQNVFGGANDFNYQRVLGFIYGAKANVSPLDFAFFVRKINPIFNDNNAVEAGAQGRSCADTNACHGVSVAGQAAPNGSDFPIIANASDSSRLAFNFVSATGFANFLNPTQSSLVLYPTNEIADRVNNPFATGIPHPGGTDFAVTDQFAIDIITWASGLRPDAQGFQRNWLVLGDFPATLISDSTLLDENTVIPKIFDQGGGSFNIGEWDGLFSDNKQVDLNTAFPRNATSGRVAYAVSYVLNTEPIQQLAQMQVSTNNPIRIYVNGLLVAQNDQSGGATALITLPPAGTANVAPPRVLIKILQRANDAQFAFSAQLKDEQGNLLTDVNGGLVFTLAPNGGI